MAFNGSGAPLTSLNATNLASGTVPVARLGSSGTPSSSTYLRGDNTWAPVAVRSGSQTATFSSTVSSITLTAASQQYITIATDGTMPASQTIVLPNMTTLALGSGYFTFANQTPMPVGIASADGVVREFIYAGAVAVLNISNISSSNGVWKINPIPNLIADNRSNFVTIDSNYRVNDATYTATTMGFVVLNANSFAHVWKEAGPVGRLAVYAELYTINLTTNAITIGNRLTLQGVSGDYVYWGDYFSWDTIGDGRALIAYNRGSGFANGTGGYYWQALSVSGGVLYASTASNRTRNGVAEQTGVGRPTYLGYLGSNSAFALAYMTADGYTGSDCYIEGVRITGTATAPTLTAFTGQTSFSVSVNPNAGIPDYTGSRTGLTTFTAHGYWYATGAQTGRAITYNPGAGSLSMVTRTSSARLVNETLTNVSSFGQEGFVYNTAANKVLSGSGFYDISNPGATNVTVTSTPTLTAKASGAPLFTTTSNSIPVGTGRKSFISSASSVISVGTLGSYGLTYSNLNPSVANFDVVVSGSKETITLTNNEGGLTLFSASDAFYLGSDSTNIYFAKCAIATPI